MADWAQRFYFRQNELCNVYVDDIQDHHQQRAALIGMQHPSAQSVLELGAGGGQVACAAALAGYDTTAVELVPEFNEHTKQLASQHNINNLTALNGDFYSIKLTQKFDVIAYWDGFGIGTDDEQIRLLNHCAGWLKPDGIVLLEISTPWYWAKVAGQKMQLEDAHRQYTFDADHCRLLDTWWHVDSPDDQVTQSIRCYSPADLRLLLRDTKLQLIEVVETGGAVDYDYGEYHANIELGQAMSYVAKIGMVL